MAIMTRLQGQPVVAGAAQGAALVADVPLSFWGGFDPESGEILDRRHPLAGMTATGRVLVIPSGRGSCSGSGVILEAIRNGTAPAAIILSRLDPIIGLGAILGDELYGACPVIVVVADEDRRRIGPGALVTISADGTVTTAPPP